MVFLPCGRALAMAPGCEKRNTPPEGGVGTPRLARLEPYRPRCRAGIGTLAASHQVAGRFAGPEPSAPLWILLPAHYMNGVRLGQAVASRQFKQILRTTPRVSTSRADPSRRVSTTRLSAVTGSVDSGPPTGRPSTETRKDSSLPNTAAICASLDNTR